MQTEYPAVQVFTGNPVRTQGYGLFAGSAGAQDWAPYCLSEATLGGASEEPSLWRAASDFEGIGTVWLAGGALCITRLQQIRADHHLAEIRQHLVLAREAAFDLSGDVSALSRFFQPFHNYDQVLSLLNKGTTLPMLSIAARNLPSVQRASYSALRRWFPPDGRDQVLPMLLSALFDDKGAVCVSGLPRSTEERLDFAIALMALLPPPLRFACTFATRMISSRGCHARFKFLWEDYQRPQPEERLFSYAEGAFNLESEPMLYFQHALQAYRAGESAFLEFGERYLQRVIELQQHYMDERSLPFIQAAQYSLLALNEWIEQDKRPSAARLFRLINRDKSLKPADLLSHCRSALNLALSEYTINAAYPPELIEQSAAALASQPLAEVALKALQANVLERPEATFELCRAWWNVPQAKTILQAAAWQKVALDAAQAHLKALQQRDERRRAHQFFNRLYRESLERTGFVLDEQTASELLRIQERAIGERGGDTSEVLETLALSARRRSAAELNSLLSANWLRALPPELSTALDPAATSGDLGRAVGAYYPTKGTALFYKFALVCLMRKQFRALLTSESLKLLIKATRPSQRDATAWAVIAHLDEQHLPEVAHVVLNQLADQSSLMTPNTLEHLMLTMWLIANDDQRADALIKQGIQNARHTVEYVARLLPRYLTYDSRGLPKVWKALQTAKPVLPEQLPNDRVDFALLTQLTYEQWLEVPSAVHSLASGLADWQAPPNTLDEALRENKRRADLEKWYNDLLRSGHAAHPSVVECAQRVFAPTVRSIARLLTSEKPNPRAAADQAAWLLQLTPPSSLFGQWAIDSLSLLLENCQKRERNTLIELLKERDLENIPNLLAESVLRRQLIPAGLTPSAFMGQLAAALCTFDRLVLWQDELSQHPEVSRRILDEWFTSQSVQLPANSSLLVYFENYDTTLVALRELIEHGQRDGQRALVRRKQQLEALRSGTQQPNSVFGMLLRWLGRLAPRPQEDAEDTQSG
jgi:hypothetical protein